MRRLYGRKEPGYMRDVLALAREMQPEPGTVTIVHVQHDAGCSFWQGLGCDCAPRVTAQNGEKRHEMARFDTLSEKRG